MGAYSYCHKCDSPMQPADFREIEQEVQVCPSCGHPMRPNRTVADALQEQADAIEQIVRLVGDLQEAAISLQKQILVIANAGPDNA